MRLARTAPLFVAFYLLTSAATAYAECAWVLWHHVTSTNPAAPTEGVWTPQHSFTANASCAPIETRMNETRGKRRDPLGFEYDSVFVCLPDTVDPRGPKGK
jgi:hypothetical protein